MNKKKTDRKRFWQKLLSQYRLVILNEETFEEQTSFRLSRLNVIIIVTFVFTFLFSGTILLVAYTPIKEYMPGYSSTQMKKQAAENAIRLDSIMNAYMQSNQQLLSIRKVLTGELNIEEFRENKRLIDSVFPIRTIPKRISEDSILRNIVEQEDKYNVIENGQSKVDFVLFPPATGNISQSYDPQNKHFAVDIVLNENDPVKAVAEGTVIFSEWTADTGYVIIIEHPYRLLSAYKHNSSLSKMQGDTVFAGEVIATAGDTGELSTGFHLHFEIWIDGYPMNPENFIDFSQNSL